MENSIYNCFIVADLAGGFKGDLPGTPKDMGPLMVSFPYHSHIFRDCYGSCIGIVWVPLTIIRGSHVLGGP